VRGPSKRRYNEKKTRGTTMDDMTARGAVLPAYEPSADYKARHKRFPGTAWMRRKAPKRVPLFAYDYGDTGAGSDVGLQHNWDALDALKIVPRYGVTNTLPPVTTKLFGRPYNAPFGIAPMGGPSIVWPGADVLFAKAAQRAGIPYTLGVAGGATIEEIAKVAPDVFWLQLYRFAHNDHKIGFDLVERAAAAGAHTLSLTLDVPVRTTRSREARAGLSGEFKPNARMMWEMITRPAWLMALMRNGYPRFATVRQYVGTNPGTNDTIRFARKEMGGAFSWEEVARYRDRWKGPMLVKGILHPADAQKAVALGVDGIWVSNHGGRQIEALMPSIDCLPGIVKAVGKKATVIFDSGVRSGHDVARALALGADAAFAGKAFLWGVGALGDAGPEHVIDLFMEELRSSLGQIGARSIAEARKATIRHPGEIVFAPTSTK
jgi:L-lactate dehydrogenase (cytochrome)